jgi:hypothetical protein
VKQHIMNVVLVHGAFADGSGWDSKMNGSQGNRRLRAQRAGGWRRRN